MFGSAQSMGLGIQFFSASDDIQHLAESVDGGCRSCHSMMAEEVAVKLFLLDLCLTGFQEMFNKKLWCLFSSNKNPLLWIKVVEKLVNCSSSMF